MALEGVPVGDRSPALYIVIRSRQYNRLLHSLFAYFHLYLEHVQAR